MATSQLFFFFVKKSHLWVIWRTEWWVTNGMGGLYIPLMKESQNNFTQNLQNFRNSISANIFYSYFFLVKNTF